MTKPDQNQLDFLNVFTLDGKPRWTRDVAIFDELPKYVFTGTKQKKLKSLQPGTHRELVVQFGGKKWKFRMNPAHVDTGSTAFIAYPGEREELVARALRYLAVQAINTPPPPPPVKFIFRVGFTFHRLRTLLAQWGHQFNSTQLNEALLILRRTNISLSVEGHKKAFYDGALLGSYSGVDDGTDERDQRRWVDFTSLEVDAIMRGDFRALNFDRIMSLEDPIDRAIYEILMREHRGAEKPSIEPGGRPPKPFQLSLSTIVTRCGLVMADRERETIKRIRASLQRLAEKGILWHERPYDEAPVYDQPKGGRRRVIEMVWSLYLSRTEVADIIAAHREAAFSDDPALKALPEHRKRELRKQAAEKNLE